MRLLQRLPPRMPDRRRHGQDEDRVPASLPCPAWAAPEGAAGRLPAPLRPAGREARRRCSTCATASRARRRARRASSTLSARRSMPRWRTPWRERGPAPPPDAVRGDGRDIVLFGDTFNRYFEPDNLAAAERVLSRGGLPAARGRAQGARPLCCGRTFLSAGLVAEAREEARRTLDTLGAFVSRGARIVGLEPSCLLHLPRRVLQPPAEGRGRAARRGIVPARGTAGGGLASGAITLPVAVGAGRKRASPRPLPSEGVRRHGRGRDGPAQHPGLEVEAGRVELLRHGGRLRLRPEDDRRILRHGRAVLLPALRRIGPDDLVVADGTSCRHQIQDGVGREAVHVARVLDAALAPAD